MDDAEAGDVLHRVLLRDVLRGLADDHSELDFPVGLLRPARNLDVVVGTARWQEVAFMKMIGSAGTAMPDSAAWSE